jgi:hypothetical protein
MRITLTIVLAITQLISYSQVYYGMLDEDKTNTSELPLQKDSTRISKIETDLGKKMGMVMIFMWYPQNIDVVGCNYLISRGITPIISLEAGMSFTSIISGTYDTYFRTFADQLKQIKGTVFLRYNHEMNGNWYSWDGFHNGANTTATANYISAWRRVHGIIKTEKQANNALWNWCVNRDSWPNETWNEPMDYYPGDGYVDWIGFDSYDKPYNYTPTKYKSVDEIFGPIYTLLTNAIADKPILIGEFASENYGQETDPHKLDFFSQGGNLFDKYPRIHAFSYFNSKKENSGRFNNYKYDNPIACLAAFKNNWISNVNMLSGSSGIENVHKYKTLSETAPLKIEAELYFDHKGIKSESCTEGGLDIGSTDVSDYMDYLIEVSTSGIYTCKLRVASNVTTGKIEIKNQTGTTLALYEQTTSTGGVQNWETHTVNVMLSSGKQKLRVYYSGAGLSLNWFELSLLEKTLDIIEVPSKSIKIFPNPFIDKLTIQTENRLNFQITDMKGVIILEKTVEAGMNNIGVSSLKSGIYLLKIEGKTFKLIKN